MVKVWCDYVQLQATSKELVNMKLEKSGIRLFLGPEEDTEWKSQFLNDDPGLVTEELNLKCTQPSVNTDKLF